MRRIAVFAFCLFATPAFAVNYPVQGEWGVSNNRDDKPIDCKGLRTIDFRGERRFDSDGGVPEFRAIVLRPSGGNTFAVTEEFRTGQINGRNLMTLRVKDKPDRVELDPQRGATITLRKCR